MLASVFNKQCSAQSPHCFVAGDFIIICYFSAGSGAKAFAFPSVHLELEGVQPAGSWPSWCMPPDNRQHHSLTQVTDKLSKCQSSCFFYVFNLYSPIYSKTQVRKFKDPC